MLDFFNAAAEVNTAAKVSAVVEHWIDESIRAQDDADSSKIDGAVFNLCFGNIGLGHDVLRQRIKRAVLSDTSSSKDRAVWPTHPPANLKVPAVALPPAYSKSLEILKLWLDKRTSSFDEFSKQLPVNLQQRCKNLVSQWQQQWLSSVSYSLANTFNFAHRI